MTKNPLKFLLPLKKILKQILPPIFPHIHNPHIIRQNKHDIRRRFLLIPLRLRGQHTKSNKQNGFKILHKNVSHLQIIRTLTYTHFILKISKPGRKPQIHPAFLVRYSSGRKSLSEDFFKKIKKHATPTKI